MQKLFGLGVGGVGIVGTLIAAGIILLFVGQQTIGMIALVAGIGIGIILGVLGIIGVLKRLAH
jgi:hypothetical protein